MNVPSLIFFSYVIKKIATLFPLEQMDQPLIYLQNQESCKNIRVANRLVVRESGIELGIYQTSTMIHRWVHPSIYSKHECLVFHYSQLSKEPCL